MGRSYFLGFLLFSAVLALCLSQGFGRKLMELETEGSAVLVEGVQENSNEAEETFETMDYTPEANTNPRAGYMFIPPPTHPSAPSPQGPQS